MFVMNFVCPPKPFEINIISLSENLDSLMNEDVMNQKVTQTINKYAYGEPEKNMAVEIGP
jgi:hypothetical protein